MYMELNLNPDDTGAVKEPHYDKLEEFVNAANTNAPEGLKNLKQGAQAWSFIPTEKELVTNAIQGIALALGFSFIIVLVTT